MFDKQHKPCQPRELFIEELERVSGGIFRWPDPVFPRPGPVMTTMALGEEDGGGIPITTMALGEEDGGLPSPEFFW